MKQNILKVSKHLQNLTLSAPHSIIMTVEPHLQTLIVDGTSIYRHISSNIILNQAMGIDMSKFEITMELSETINNVTNLTAILNADISMSAEIQLNQAINAILTYLIDASSEITLISEINAVLSVLLDVASGVTLQQVISTTLVSVKAAIVSDYANTSIADLSSYRICDLREIEIA